MRRAVLAFAILPLLACSPSDTPSCPGNTVATFRLEGSLVPKDDPRIALDPVPESLASTAKLLDCTPDPLDESAPIRYPKDVAFEAKLAADPFTSAAALCRSNGVVYSGQRTGATRYEVEADADPAVPCVDSVCAATLRVIVAGDVLLDAGGAPEGFHGVLVEALTEDRGACEACLPSVPTADPPMHACAARYALTGTLP